LCLQPSGYDHGEEGDGAKKVQATAARGIRHARLELPDDDYERLKRVAKSNGLAVAAYIRQAVLKQVRRDESEGEGGK
jgi:predicted DNA-binding protein